MHQPLFLLYGISQRRAIGRLWHGVAVIFIFGPGKEFLCYGDRILFDRFTSNVYILLIGSAIIIVFVGLLAKKTFYSLDR